MHNGTNLICIFEWFFHWKPSLMACQYFHSFPFPSEILCNPWTTFEGYLVSDIGFQVDLEFAFWSWRIETVCKWRSKGEWNIRLKKQVSKSQKDSATHVKFNVQFVAFLSSKEKLYDENVLSCPTPHAVSEAISLSLLSLAHFSVVHHQFIKASLRHGN